MSGQKREDPERLKETFRGPIGVYFGRTVDLVVVTSVSTVVAVVSRVTKYLLSKISNSILPFRNSMGPGYCRNENHTS